MLKLNEIKKHPVAIAASCAIGALAGVIVSAVSNHGLVGVLVGLVVGAFALVISGSME